MISSILSRHSYMYEPLQHTFLSPYSNVHHIIIIIMNTIMQFVYEAAFQYFSQNLEILSNPWENLNSWGITKSCTQEELLSTPQQLCMSWPTGCVGSQAKDVSYIWMCMHAQPNWWGSHFKEIAIGAGINSHCTTISIYYISKGFMLIYIGRYG